MTQDSFVRTSATPVALRKTRTSESPRVISSVSLALKGISLVPGGSRLLPVHQPSAFAGRVYKRITVMMEGLCSLPQAIRTP